MDETKSNSNKPYVRMVEQPASRVQRFRYVCEGRSASTLPGINSTLETKTFPSIKVENYDGNACVVISCISKDAPYR